MVALYHCMYKIKYKKATSLIFATKTAKKQYKTVKMAPNSQFLHLHLVLMEWKNILIVSSIVVLYYRKYVMQKGSLFMSS